MYMRVIWIKLSISLVWNLLYIIFFVDFNNYFYLFHGSKAQKKSFEPAEFIVVRLNGYIPQLNCHRNGKQLI